MTKQKGKYILSRSCYDKTAWVQCLRTSWSQKRTKTHGNR